MGTQRGAFSVVEAGYRLDASEQEWVDGLADAASDKLGEARGATVYTVTCSPALMEMIAYARHGNSPSREMLAEAVSGSEAANASLQDAFYRSHRVGTTSEQLGKLGLSSLAVWHRQLFRRYGFEDSIGVLINDGGPTVSVLSGSLARVRSPTAEESRRWSLVSSHLSNAQRIRRLLSPERSVTDEAHPLNGAILSPSGRLEHAGELALSRPVQAELRESVRALERIRSGRASSCPDDALGLWEGLCAGDWTLVDRFDSDGKRFVVACRNDRSAHALHALSGQELRVVRLASEGQTNFQIGFELGLSGSTVATHLTSAMAKLGIGRRTLLSSVHGILSHAENQRFAVAEEPLRIHAVAAPQTSKLFAGLTASERDIAERLARGEDTKAIARARGAQLRTIANQIASILRKTQTQSRAELAARASAGPDASAPSR